jgi:hypothetical protein
MTYEKLIEMVLAGRSTNATAKALGIPQKTFESYVKAIHFPPCSTTMLLARTAGVDLETAVKAVAKKEMEIKTKSEKVKIALDKLSVSFKTLLRGANVGGKRVPATA